MAKPVPTNQRILVVDDNKDGGRSLAMLLTSTGREVRLAADGETALRALDDFQPQVVVLDIGLPDMDGYEVARLIRQQRDKTVTLIAMTGVSPEGGDRDKDFDHYFVKPINFEKLLAALKPD